MKYLFTLLLTASMSFLFAQSPQEMSYQGIVRAANGDPVTSQTIGVQISILSGSATGTVVYAETHSESTNVNGLLTLSIGTGTIVSGTFSSIDWGANTYYIKSEVDPDGGTTYEITGTSQLLSVPYALYAADSGATGDDLGNHTASDNLILGSNAISDINTEVGTAGQVLSSTGSGVDWVDATSITPKFVDGTTATNAVYSAGSVGVGVADPHASAAFEVNSTTQGMLIPRMDSPQRDAITTPANGLLIFNTSNNSFEVYKSSCSCWVRVADNGNTPANNLVNTPPRATSTNYTGEFRVGGTATLVYTYDDAQSDAEGFTGIQWQIANSNQGTNLSNLGTAASQTFTTLDALRYVRACVTPRAATGLLNGAQVCRNWVRVDAANVPTATGVAVNGTPAEGTQLIGDYTFTGGSGTEFVDTDTDGLGPDIADADDKSLYNWQTATNTMGVGTANILVASSQPKHYAYYTPNASQTGRYIRFGVRAKDDATLTAASYVYSDWVGPITLALEAAPTAENISFSAAPGANVTLTTTYDFLDVNSDPEGASIFQWYKTKLSISPIPLITHSYKTITVRNIFGTAWILPIQN